MKVIILLVIFVVSFSFGEANTFGLKHEVEKAPLAQGRKCYFGEIEFLTPINCSASTIHGSSVPHSTTCTFEIVNDETMNISRKLHSMKHLVCDDGHWSGTYFSVGRALHRHRRFLGFIKDIVGGIGDIVGGIGDVVGGIGDVVDSAIGTIGNVVHAFSCAFLCVSGHSRSTNAGPPPVTYIPPPVTYFPPQFVRPCRPTGVNDMYNVAADGSAVVRWDTTPQATDGNEDDHPKVELVRGTNTGSYAGSLYGKDYTITYSATDKTGLKDYCSFTFTVKEASCSSPPWSENARHNCQDFRVGKQCQYHCSAGYELVGNSIVRCENVESPHWTTMPKCLKKKCQQPAQLANGQINCQSYDYQSFCTMSCNTGYELQGQMFTQCQSDGTWLKLADTKCIDMSPPSLHCKSPQIFHADRGSLTTSVTWEEPTVTDKTDPSPRLIKTSGPDMGVTMSGTKYVSYMAIDEDGNVSPECNIELRVQEITCGHPSSEFQNVYLQFECSDTKFIYGGSCNLSCLVNLPLNGTNKITCERDGDKNVGVWDWGNGKKPFCEAISCPELDPPINGALVYDTVKAREVYTMVCNDKYDIPPMGNTFHGMFICLDKTGWQPIHEVPDCVRARSSRGLHLPGQIFYYSGECSTPEAQAQIKQNFIKIVQQKIVPLLNNVCPPGDACSTKDLHIECGAVQNNSGRRKRQVGSDVLVVHFNIALDINLPSGHSLSSVLDKYDKIVEDISSDIQTLLVSGSLDLDNFVTHNDSWNAPPYADIACDPGFIPDGTDKCKSCPPGHFPNETSNDCQKCPIGQYSGGNGTLVCKTCPDGFTTRRTGSKSLDNCTALCGPGTISPDGLMPCSSCQFGEYQDGMGQTSCKQCPRGTTTITTKTSTSLDCHSFDILIDNSNAPVSIGEISDLNQLTLMMWAKRVDGQDMSIMIQLQSDGNDRLLLDIADTIRVQIPTLIDEVVETSISKLWTHIAVVWDSTDSSFDVYINGNMTYSTTITRHSPLVSNGRLILTSSGKSGMLLSGFHLMDKRLNVTEVSTFSSSCHLTNMDAIIGMDNVRRVATRAIVTVPSNCDAVDNCRSDPCNGHHCIDGHDTFTCRCTSGWTGHNCSIPPDYCINNECANGSTCKNGVKSYTCSCPLGYTGHMCDIPPVDGGWSEWEIASACSQVCGSGSLNRTRRCDSPSPGPYGADCIGDSEDTIPCNTDPCPICDELPIKNGTRKSCVTDAGTGIRTCQLFCKDGKVMQPAQDDTPEYKCGPDTNFEWGAVDSMPSCVEQASPSKLSIQTSIKYKTNIQDKDEKDITNSLLENFKATPCADDCKIDIERSGNTFTVVYSVDLTHGQDLHVDEYINSGEVSESLKQLIQSVSSLELTAQHLQNNTSEMFDVEVNGEVYAVDADSLTSSGEVICPPGQVAHDGVCVQCPAGTYSTEGYCIFCDKGTYQPSMGESTCMQCPDPLTTASIGSADLSNCIDPPSMYSGPTYPPPSTSNTALTLAVSVSCVALLVASLAFVFVWYKKFRPRTKVEGSVADVRGGWPTSAAVKPDYKHNSRPVFSMPSTHSDANSLRDVNLELSSSPIPYNDYPPPEYTK